MPKKKKPESQAEQSSRFQKDAQKMIEDGELNPTDAKRVIDDNLRDVVLQAKVRKRHSA